MKSIYNITVKATFIVLILTVIGSILLGIQDPRLLTFLSQKTGEAGTLLLYLMLVGKSLYFILKKIDISKDNLLFKFLQENIKYQREQGLIVFNILFIHSYIATLTVLSNFNLLIFDYFTVLIPTLVLIYMEFTSFRFFQSKLKKWKKSHTIIWLTLPLILLHVVLVSQSGFKYLILTIIIFLIATIEIIVDIKKGSRHLGYLIIGLVIALFQFSVSKLFQNHQTSNLAIDDAADNNIVLEAPSVEVTSQVTSEATSQASNETTSEANSQASSEANNQATQATSSVYQNGTFSGEGYGHNGSIAVDTTIQDDKIIDIEVTSQNEDGPWWDPVLSTIPAEIIQNNSTEGVSDVAGSTYSSEGLIDAVDNSLENAKTTTENATI